MTTDKQEAITVQEVMFNGTGGRIEGRFHKNPNPTAPIALIISPSPLRQGTMNNKVVFHIFHAFARQGFSVLRFNFRGVGKSQGVIGESTEEIMDAQVALDWLQIQCPEYSGCWIGGFSFGAWVALHLSMRRPEVNGFTIVAPPVSIYDFNFLSPCPTLGLIIQGTKDTVVSEEEVRNFHQKVAAQRIRTTDMQKNKQTGIRYATFPTGHGFEGHFDALSLEIEEFLIEQQMAQINENNSTRRSKRDRKRRLIG